MSEFSEILVKSLKAVAKAISLLYLSILCYVLNHGPLNTWTLQLDLGLRLGGYVVFYGVNIVSGDYEAIHLGSALSKVA